MKRHGAVTVRRLAFTLLFAAAVSNGEAAESRASSMLPIQAVDAERSGDYERALQLWRHISRTEQTPVAAVAEAKICWILNKPAEAKAALEVAIRRDARCSSALSLMARLLLAEGDADAAMSNLEHACDADANNPEAQRLLADLLAHAGMLDQAAPHYAQLLKVQPFSVHARQNVVAYLATHGRLEEATKVCREGLPNNNAPAKLRLELGHLYLQAGRFSDAYEAFKAARESGSSDTEPYQMLAIVCGARGDWVSAMNYAQSYCDIEAESVNPIMLAAWAAYRANDLLEAKIRFERVNEIVPNDADLRNLYAVVLQDLHRWPAAAEQLVDAQKADSANPFPQMNNATLQMLTEKPADAVADAETVVKQHPDMLVAKSLLAYMLLMDGKPAEAAKLAENVLKADAGDILAHVVCARILRGDSCYEEALAHLTDAEGTVGGANSLVQVELAETWLAKGEVSKATTAAQFALQLAPASLDAKHALARALERQGNWDGAALYLRELSARRPKDLAAKLELGDAMVHQGDSVGAQLTYEAAQKLAPWSDEVVAGLAKVAEMQGNRALARKLLRRASRHHDAPNPSPPR